MTCAITPAPTTPTLRRSAMGYSSCIGCPASSARSGQRGLDQDRAFLDAGFRVDERVLVFDGNRLHRRALEAGDELMPPCLVLAVAGDREVPRHFLRRRRPSVV